MLTEESSTVIFLLSLVGIIVLSANQPYSLIISEIDCYLMEIINWLFD